MPAIFARIPKIKCGICDHEIKNGPYDTKHPRWRGEARQIERVIPRHSLCSEIASRNHSGKCNEWNDNVIWFHKLRPDCFLWFFNSQKKNTKKFEQNAMKKKKYREKQKRDDLLA